MSRSRLAARRYAASALAFVNTKKVTRQPAAKLENSRNDTFRLIPSTGSDMFFAPSRGDHIWVGGWSCDLAPKAAQLGMTEGTQFKSQARLWQNAAGRVFLEAAAAQAGRSLTFLDGVEVRPFSTYYINPGCQVAFTIQAANNSGSIDEAAVPFANRTPTADHSLAHQSNCQLPRVVSFTVEYDEAQVGRAAESDNIQAMLVNFGRLSTWQQSVLDREALGRMEASQDPAAPDRWAPPAAQNAKYIYRHGHPFCSA